MEVKRSDESDTVFLEDPGAFCLNDNIDGRVGLTPAKDLDLAAVRWEILETGFFSDTVVASGSGTNFTSQPLPKKASYKVVFYCDANKNSKFDGGERCYYFYIVIKRDCEFAAPTQ